MDVKGIAGQVTSELKGVGEETGKQLGQAGEDIVKGTVNELLGGNGQGGQVEQGGRENDQQVPVISETERLKQRKEAEKQRGLKRVRMEMANYVKWRKQLEEELSVKEDNEKVERKVIKKKKKESFWSGFLGRTRSRYAGTGENVKLQN